MELSFGLVLSNVGTLICFFLGLVAVFKPLSISKFVSLSPIDSTGVSEIQATYGGFFIGLSLVVFYFQDRLGFLILSFGWGFAALVRIFSFLSVNRETKNFAGIIFELSISLLVGSGAIFSDS